jgi:hypothetical protein
VTSETCHAFFPAVCCVCRLSRARSLSLAARGNTGNYRHSRASGAPVQGQQAMLPTLGRARALFLRALSLACPSLSLSLSLSLYTHTHLDLREHIIKAAGYSLSLYTHTHLDLREHVIKAAGYPKPPLELLSLALPDVYSHMPTHTHTIHTPHTRRHTPYTRDIPHASQHTTCTRTHSRRLLTHTACTHTMHTPCTRQHTHTHTGETEKVRAIHCVCVCVCVCESVRARAYPSMYINTQI